MAAANNLIQFKRTFVSGRVPNATDSANTTYIAPGQLALNLADNKLFTSNGSVAIELGSNLTNLSVTNTISLKSLLASGSLGTAGQVLASNGDVTYWKNDESSAALNTLYVSKSGNDANDGTSLSQAKLTIADALEVATSGTTIFVKSGDYTELNPMSVPAGVSIVGDNLRTTTVRPATTNLDLFHVRNKCYITGFTFRDHVSPAAAVAFPLDGSAGAIVTSPYIQNCSSITTTGTGMRVDGALVSGLRSMVTDSYTQFNQGGIGIHIKNRGYAQLVSIFTICCDIGIFAEDGGSCSMSLSNSSFGNKGVYSKGLSGVLNTGTAASGNVPGKIFNIANLNSRPKVGEAIKINGAEVYYTIKDVDNYDSNLNTATLTLLETIEVNVTAGEFVQFYQRSLILASGHTFEFIGTGTSILTATPELGGIPDQTLEIVEEGGGKVYYSSTDQWGDFRIGDGLLFNNADGTIEGDTFEKSLFAILTPYILAIEG